MTVFALQSCSREGSLPCFPLPPVKDPSDGVEAYHMMGLNGGLSRRVGGLRRVVVRAWGNMRKFLLIYIYPEGNALTRCKDWSLM